MVLGPQCEGHLLTRGIDFPSEGVRKYYTKATEGEKLQAKLAEDPSLDIDVDRALKVSDLTTGDLTASIDISLPKKWTERFHTKAEFKRIMKTPEEEEQNSDNDTQGGGSNSGGPSTEG